jgi:deaminated glutathione amidase
MSTALRKPAIAAIAQLCSTSNKWQNLLDIATCARLAKQQGSSMLFLPECFGFMGESSLQTLEQAEDPIDQDGNSNPEELTQQLCLVVAGENDSASVGEADRVYLLDGLRTIARQSGLWISGGGMHESGAPKDPESGNMRVYNTHVILDDHGEVKAIYRKIHLFDVSIPGKVQLRESATTAPGTKLVTCDCPLGELNGVGTRRGSFTKLDFNVRSNCSCFSCIVGKLGLSTCYDMRFPEMYIPLVQAGAQILLMPSAFTVPTGAAHWHTLLKGMMQESLVAT